MRARRGHLLAEALCALALGGVLAAAAAGTLAQARRSLGAQEARMRGVRGVAEALEVSAALVRAADSVAPLGDTALALSVRVAEGVSCARSGDTLVLPPVRPGEPTLVRLALAPESGDRLRAWVEDSITGYAAWVEAEVLDASARPGEAACGPGGGFADAADVTRPRWHLWVPGLDPRVGTGAAIRLAREGRLAPYLSGGEWMLGWRRCARGVCGIVQPLAGPLRRPRDGGFRVGRDPDDVIRLWGAPPLGASQHRSVPRLDAAP